MTINNEVVDGIYPEHFEKDLIELLDLFDPLVNGKDMSVSDETWYKLWRFLDEYKGDSEFR